MSRDNGFSLVELMIGLTIGLFVVIVVLTVYLGTKTSFNRAQNTNNLQGVARFTTQYLAEQLMSIGYVGGPAPEVVDLSSSLKPTFDCSATSDYTTKALNPFCLDVPFHVMYASPNFIADHINGTPILIIKRALPTRLTDLNSLSADRFYVVANPMIGTIYNPTKDSLSNSLIAPGGAIPYGYAWPYEPRIFYLSNAYGDNPALIQLSYSIGNEWIPSVVSDGIEDYQLEFGINESTPVAGAALSLAAPVSIMSDPTAIGDTANGALYGPEQAVYVKIFVLARALVGDSSYVNDIKYTFGPHANLQYNDNRRRVLHETAYRMYNMYYQRVSAEGAL